MTKKENRQILMNELARFFNANIGRKVGYPCRGDWKGTIDYAVLFNNNEEMFISNGMKNFDKNLQNEINIFSQFHRNKQTILDKLLEMQQIDNLHAEARGLREYKVIDLDYAKSGSNIGWFYLTICVNGMKRNVCETDLNYAVSGDIEDVINYINKAKSNNLRIAGGLSESEVDFIFNGYGHCSTSKLYSLNI